MAKQFTNHLINETSPYLLQHAHNPVNWYPWGEAALQKAIEESKVILVSIGYSACHWCHVMERESFEDETTARLMNEHFINIKIDREERPDLDHIYMDAVQAISGSGGWPLNVFLTPEAKPFFGGTYFPPVKAFNRSSWTEVLNGISQAWSERKNEIESQAENLMDHLHKSNNFVQTNMTFSLGSDKFITMEHCDSMFTTIMSSADKDWGGFGNAPKFPQTFTIQYLLQYHYFTGNAEALRQALLSIDKMLHGGIYDQVVGGLARYSTDKEWLAPHFEKMLYDNALFINILCDAYQLTSEKKYDNAIRKTINFVEKDLLSSEGGFYAAIDADSEGVEGKYYVWQKQEIDDLLGEDSLLFCEFFDVSQAGNWDESNILRILKPLDDFVSERQLDKGIFDDTIKKCLQKLSAFRDTRVKPSIDDKVILGWNALMLKAISKASIVLQDETYGEMAERNFNFLLQHFGKPGEPEMMHTYKKGKAKYPAFLDDYAYLIAVCLQLYQQNFDLNYLFKAREYCRYVVENFSDEESVFFFFTSVDQKDVIVRKKEVYDGAIPSGNSIMAYNLHILAIIFDDAEWRNRLEKMLQAISAAVIKYPVSFGIWASHLLQIVMGINEVAVVGKSSKCIGSEINLKYIPNMILMATNFSNNDFPLLANKPPGLADKIYLCKNYTCKAPFSDIHVFMSEINKANKITK